ncbi:FAD binding domain of DNA photolyase family protein [Lyngbya aestuarii BL J]|uniref:FAD binding domain of DNA photolyase family protein n=1 Tax=Lyngbya aestuarii BL J TaxID=1348334 RepID=U7QNN8_9CYAN|nr:cryptochrome/photolyase family protein [Lyngbya aestuarii]ERT09478.1 FAD binding domain of DNA photolyase family protein [Lyngbya aestuarii BL J]
MTVGIWILGDQLWSQQAALQSADSDFEIPIILIESLEFVRVRPDHRQKLVLVWSAMRHFAAELREAGWSVTYIITEKSVEVPLKKWIKDHQITQLRVMIPNDRPFQEFIQNLNLSCQIDWLENNHFLWKKIEFKQWSKGRKRLLMEDFYRESRKRFNILMEDKQPIGNRWNFDSENRKPPKVKLNPPHPLWFEPDEITQTTIEQVNQISLPLYGKTEPFRWAVTRQQALKVLQSFIAERLPNFGAYQDAMVTGEQTLWHALLSPYLNLGLLNPLEVIQAAETAYYQQNLPLNCVEGFIRQVLGWREYMQGIYQLMDADYSQHNYFNHTQSLPKFFWDAEKTDMNCLSQVLSQVENTGYAHHIQRLMILSNFALIAGLSPQEVENWFHAVFIDAYDWVMQTNVIGMGLFADGGILASKPYAASANYVNKMSDYCKGCVYNPRSRTGEKACPFNIFYWDFLDRHRETLKSLGRMNLVLRHLDKMSENERQMIHQQAVNWRSRF